MSPMQIDGAANQQKKRSQGNAVAHPVKDRYFHADCDASIGSIGQCHPEPQQVAMAGGELIAILIIDMEIWVVIKGNVNVSVATDGIPVGTAGVSAVPVSSQKSSSPSEPWKAVSSGAFT